MFRLLFLFAGLAIATAQQAKLKLINARFADGKYLTLPGRGKFPPSYAIDGKIKGFGINEGQGFAHSSKAGVPFVVDIAGANMNNQVKVSVVVIHPRKDQHNDKYMHMRVSAFYWGKFKSTIQRCKPVTKFDALYVRRSMEGSRRGLEWICPHSNNNFNTIWVTNPRDTAIMEISAWGSTTIVNPTCTLSNAKFADNRYFRGGMWNLHPKFAIDGLIQSDNKGTSFAHSATRGGKFLVNVPKGAKVNSVTIYPRRDCCFDRYSSMSVTLSNSLLRTAPQKCIPPKMDTATVRSSINTGLKFVCSGNYAADTIEVDNRDFIQIAEIKADC